MRPVDPTPEEIAAECALIRAENAERDAERERQLKNVQNWMCRPGIKVIKDFRKVDND